MAVTVTHPFVSAIADGADATVVRPSNWNATHSISGTLDVANGGTGVTSSTGTGSTVLSASPTFTGTLAAAAITASTTLGVTGIASIGPNPIAISGAAIDVGNNRNSPTRVGVSNQNSGASATAGIELEAAGGGWKIDVPADTATFVNPLIFSFNTTERMRISGSGLMTVGGGAVIQGLTVGLGANAVASNTAVGEGALNSGSLSGSNNLAIGLYSLFGNTTGGNNTAVGKQALSGNTTGYQNVAVGEGAIASNLVNGYNTALGNAALNLSTGNNNLGLGHSAGSALTTGSNNTIIGSVAGTAGLSDTVIIAAGSAERMRIDSSGNVGIGVSVPGAKLDISSTSPKQIKISGANQNFIAIGSSTGSAGFLIGRSSQSNNNNDFFIFDEAASAFRMAIDSTGAVSIPGTLTVTGGISGGTF